jgi:hypothetical protein
MCCSLVSLPLKSSLFFSHSFKSALLVTHPSYLPSFVHPHFFGAAAVQFDARHRRGGARRAANARRRRSRLELDARAAGHSGRRGTVIVHNGFILYTSHSLQRKSLSSAEDCVSALPVLATVRTYTWPCQRSFTYHLVIVLHSPGSLVQEECHDEGRRTMNIWIQTQKISLTKKIFQNITKICKKNSC